MNQSFFKEIVKKIPSTENYPIDYQTERRVIYRPKTGQTIVSSGDKANLAERVIYQNDEHYIINSSSYERIETECDIYSLKDQSEVKISIACYIGCLKGKEDVFLQFMHRSHNIDGFLNQLFIDWTNVFSKNRKISLRLSFDEIKEQLRTHYETFARTKGIRLQVTSLELKNNEVQDFNFITNENSYDCFEDTYKTNAADVTVRLSVVVNAKANSLADIPERYRKPGMSVLNQIKIQTIECIRRWMRAISPEEIYLEHKDQKINELERTLRQFYKQEFNIDDCIFNLYSLDNEFVNRLKSIMSEEGFISVQNDSKEINYNIIYKINGVSNWHRFKLHQEKYYGNALKEYADINSIIKHDIENELNNVSNIDEFTLDNLIFDRLITQLFIKTSKEKIENEYGIILGSPHIRGNGRIGEPPGSGFRRLKIYLKHEDQLYKYLEEATINGEEDRRDKVESQLTDVQEKIKDIRNKLTAESKNKIVQKKENDELQ